MVSKFIQKRLNWKWVGGKHGKEYKHYTNMQTNPCPSQDKASKHRESSSLALDPKFIDPKKI